jgi:hypothetical protein
VLYLARHLGYGMLQVPLEWEHRRQSQVQPAHDALAMLGELLRVRVNSWTGKYRYDCGPLVMNPALLAQESTQ